MTLLLGVPSAAGACTASIEILFESLTDDDLPSTLGYLSPPIFGYANYFIVVGNNELELQKTIPSSAICIYVLENPQPVNDKRWVSEVSTWIKDLAGTGKIDPTAQDKFIRKFEEILTAPREFEIPLSPQEIAGIRTPFFVLIFVPWI